MVRELPSREQALRKLPLPYSLALRLRDAGVAPEVVCEYLNVEVDALEGIYRMAEAKLRGSSGHGVAGAEGKASPGGRELRRRFCTPQRPAILPPSSGTRRPKKAPPAVLRCWSPTMRMGCRQRHSVRVDR
jgi:hypothetical protein